MARTPSVSLIAPARCWIASRSIMIDKAWRTGQPVAQAACRDPYRHRAALRPARRYPGRGKLHRRADPSQCGEGLPAAIPRRFGRLTHTVKKRPVCELFARCSRAAVPTASRARRKSQYRRANGPSQERNRRSLVVLCYAKTRRFRGVSDTRITSKYTVDSLTESIGFEPAVAV